MKYLISIAVHFAILTSALWAQNTFLMPIDTLEIALDKNDYYIHADANDETLVFFNLSTKNIIYYNFRENKLNKIIPIKGRGPAEYVQIVDIFINHENTIYILDGSLLKFILFNTNGEYIEDISHDMKALMIDIIKNNNTYYGVTVMDYHNGSYYHELNFIENNKVSIKTVHPNNDQNDVKQFKNPFNFKGKSDVNDHHSLHAH